MELVIRKPRKQDLPALCCLWTEAFGDSMEYANFALSRLSPEKFALCGYFEDALAGMMLLLPGRLTIDGLSVEACYLYAVATALAFRGRGVMRTLESAASSFLKRGGVSAVVLVPAGAELLSMYQKLGYRTRFYLGETLLAPAIKPCAALFNCEKEEFLSLRQALLLKKSSRMELDSALCGYRYEELLFSGASVFRAETGQGAGYLVSRKEGEACRILETGLSGPALSHAAGELAKQYGVRRILLNGQSGVRRPYGMLKLLDGRLEPATVYTADAYMNLMLN